MTDFDLIVGHIVGILRQSPGFDSYEVNRTIGTAYFAFSRSGFRCEQAICIGDDMVHGEALAFIRRTAKSLTI